MPALFPLAFLIAEPALSAWRESAHGRAPRRCRQPRPGRRDLSRRCRRGGDTLRPRQHRARPCAARRTGARRSGRLRPGVLFRRPAARTTARPGASDRRLARPRHRRARQLAPRAGRGRPVRSRARGRAPRRRAAGVSRCAAARRHSGQSSRASDVPIVAALPDGAPRRRVASRGALAHRAAGLHERESAPKRSESCACRRRPRRAPAARRGAVDQLHPARVQRRREPAGAADPAERRAAPALRALGDRRRQRRQQRRHRDRDRCPGCTAATSATSRCRAISARRRRSPRVSIARAATSCC